MASSASARSTARVLDGTGFGSLLGVVIDIPRFCHRGAGVVPSPIKDFAVRVGEDYTRHAVGVLPLPRHDGRVDQVGAEAMQRSTVRASVPDHQIGDTSGSD